MKKVILRTLSAVLALASVFSIVSCGGGGKSENTIRYYIWGNEKDTMIVNKIIDGFEAVYPEYNVELEVSAGASASYFNNLQTYFGGGEAPDVFMIRGGVIESYIKNEMLLDLTPYIQAENGVFKESDLWELNDIYRSKGDGIMGEGNLYAVIKDWSPDFTMIYNKNLIEKYNQDQSPYTAAVKGANAGKTLQEVVGYPSDDGVFPSSKIAMSWAQSEKMCHELTVMKDGKFVVYGTTMEQKLHQIRQWTQQQGVSLFAEDHSKFIYDSEELEKATQHYVNYQYGALKSCVPTNESSTSGTASFKNGDTAVIWNGRWAFTSYNWYDANFDIGLAPPPMPEAGKTEADNYATSLGIAHAVSADSKAPDVAWKFIEYYMTAGQLLTIEDGFNIPGNKSIANNQFLSVEDEQQRKINEWFVWMGGYSHGLEFNPHIDSSRMDGILAAYIPRIWASTQGLSLQTALEKAGKEINSYISQSLK